MDLEELRTEFEIPPEVARFCSRNGLHDLNSIQMHEAKYDGFMDLPGCDAFVERALVNLLSIVRLRDNRELDELPDLAPMAAVRGPHKAQVRRKPAVFSDSRTALANVVHQSSGLADLNLDQIVMLFFLSVRAYNVCDANGLTTLSAINHFHSEHVGFSKLRNCGKKTELELIDLLHAARRSGYLSNTLTGEARSLDEAVLQRIFMRHYMALSKRARNVLDRHIDKPDARSAIRFFVEQGRRMPKLPGAAAVTMAELRTMQEQLLTSADDYAVMEAQGIQQEVPTEIALWCKLNNVPEESLVYLQDDQSQLTALRFIRHLLGEQDTAKAGRVYHAYLGLSVKERSLEELANEVGLSRERIRQMIERIDRDYPSRLAFLHDLPGAHERYSELMSKGTVVVLTEEIRDRLNEQEGSDCSTRFLAILSQVFNGLEYEQGYWRDFGLASVRAKELQHRYPFIVRSSQVQVLRVIFKELFEKATQPRRAPESIDAYSLIQDKSSMNRDELVHASIALAQCAFPDIEVVGAQLVLQPNKKRKQEDILKEILLELDVPSHACLIMDRWNERLPERPVTIGVIRSVAQRNKKLFFSISRTSTYGLRQWERDRPSLKGGTLRDIVEEELKRSHRPMHLNELTLAIGRYRKYADPKSIRTNLSLDRSGRFIALSDGFFGLASRQYSELRSDLRNVPSSLLRASVLRKFIGGPLVALIDHLVDRAKVHRDIVVATVELLVNEGRIILSPSKTIIHVTSEPMEPDHDEPFNDEFAFPED